MFQRNGTSLEKISGKIKRHDTRHPENGNSIMSLFCYMEKSEREFLMGIVGGSVFLHFFMLLGVYAGILIDRCLVHVDVLQKSFYNVGRERLLPSHYFSIPRPSGRTLPVSAHNIICVVIT